MLSEHVAHHSHERFAYYQPIVNCHRDIVLHLLRILEHGRLKTRHIFLARPLLRSFQLLSRGVLRLRVDIQRLRSAGNSREPYLLLISFRIRNVFADLLISSDPVLRFEDMNSVFAVFGKLEELVAKLEQRLQVFRL